MSDHPNVTTINRMTPAIFSQDRDALDAIFTEDLSFHMRGPEGWSGDYAGVAGLLGALGRVFEATGGDVRIDQQFCIGADSWAAEWEHATLGRNGRTLESKNAFIYRFEDERVAEMWMFIGADPEKGKAFFA